jgi:hypothetical protein
VLLSYYSGDAEDLAARVARDHHERRNGTGYPRNVRLADPLVEIVAACDVYDALVSSRPYRPISYDNRTALEEITQMAEQGEIGWEVVKALVALNRRSRPRFTEVEVSRERRGAAPPGNVYGVTIEEPREGGAGEKRPLEERPPGGNRRSSPRRRDRKEGEGEWRL